MKEVNLIIDGKGELSFMSEPYVRINVMTKETYEKLADVIDRDTPAEIKVNPVASDFGQKYEAICPSCANVIGRGPSKIGAVSFIGSYCPHCGQALVSEVQE